MEDTQGNPYLDFLGAEPPDLEALVQSGAGRGAGGPYQATRKDLIACAILEAGRPLALPDVAARLRRAGLRTTPRQVAAELRRDGRARSLIVRGPGESLDLDLHTAELDRLVWDLGLRPGTPELSLVSNAQADTPGDDVRLSIVELQQGFGDADLEGVDAPTQAVAVLDAHEQGSMTLAAVDAVLAELTDARSPLVDAPPRAWRDTAAEFVADGPSVALLRGHSHLQATRRRVRGLAAAQREAERELQAAERGERELFEHAYQYWKRNREIYRGLRRAVLHALPGPTEPTAAASLTFNEDGTAQVQTFLSDELDSLRALLDQQDAVAGQDPRACFHALGLDAHRPILLDLVPDSWDVAQEGRRQVTRLDRRKLLAVATGHRIPRGRRLERLCNGADPDRLRAQLRADVWAVATMYRFGVLHRGISCESGMHELFAPTTWGLPGEPDMPELLSDAMASGSLVACRTRQDIGDSDPWGRARVGRLVSANPQELVLEGRWGRRSIRTCTVADVRVVPAR